MVQEESKIILLYLHIQKFKGKLQNTLVKFGSVWILHLKISEFEIYFLKFWGVWILHHDVSEFGF